MSLFVNQTCESACWTVEYFVASIIYAADLWICVLFSYFIMYSWICLKNCSVIFTEVINENMYSHGRGKIYDLLNKPLCVFVCFAWTIILTILFCRVTFFITVRWITHLNYSILHYKVQISKNSYFESSSIADVNHRPSYMTCCR